VGPLQAGDPREVGRYRLLGRLGAGGMGQVFLGRSPGGWPVAVKLVRPDLADDPEFRGRFAREVAVARQVGGIYTAHVVDADPTANPPWLVTDYIPGPSLAEAIKEQGHLPERAVRVLGAGLAEGLAAIHACGIIHRDLKPGNVILASGGPRVIDFGIARAVDTTKQATVIGTPGFMSPEQLRGGDIDPGSDVFSFGAVLAYAATGVRPSGNRLGNDAAYSAQDLAELSPDLASLITACLAEDPAQRPGLSAILDQLAASAGEVEGWLPPGLTKMITTRYIGQSDELGGTATDSHGPSDVSSGQRDDDPSGPSDPQSRSLPMERRSVSPAGITSAVAVAVAVVSLTVTGVVLGSASRSDTTSDAAKTATATVTATVTETATSDQMVVGGNVSCASGNPVAGVWAEATHGSGFAFIRLNSAGSTFSYLYPLQGSESYTLHVGCGGTAKHWAVSIDDAPKVSGRRNSFVCNDIRDEPGYGTCTTE